MKKTLIFLCALPLTVFGGASITSNSGGTWRSAPPPVQLYDASLMAQQAREREESKLAQAFITESLNRDPWRIVNGHTNHITAHWVRFSGKILQVTADGVRIGGNYENFDGSREDVLLSENADFFVRHFPYQAAENDRIGSGAVYLAMPCGTYTYTSVMGASRTIHALDYCEPCNAPTPSVEQVNAVKAAADAKKKAVAERTLKWNEDQAAAGDAYGQFRMGERYRDGDGVTMDVSKAREMFQKSAAQGNKEATAALDKLPAQ